MLRAVLRPDLLGGRLFSVDPAPATFSLQPIKESVLPGETFLVAIVASTLVSGIHLKVRVTRAFADERSDPPQEIPVDYDGGPLRSIPIEFQAPGDRATLLFQLFDPAGQPKGDPRSVLVVA